MKRFFGMMPSSEVEKVSTFKDDLGLKINIEAGPHGWTVIYADNSTDYKDQDATTEENYQSALEELYKHFDKNSLTEVNDSDEIRVESII